MKHTERGLLRAYLDDQLDPQEHTAVEQHLEDCAVCKEEQAALLRHATRVHESLEQLPYLHGEENVATAWAAFQKKQEDWKEREEKRWPLSRRLLFAGAALSLVTIILVLTVAPVRAWAESLLAVFRVQRLTVLQIDPASLKAGELQSNQLLNQAIGRLLSDQITVTQKPEKPQLITDPATASKMAGFAVHLLPDATPSSLLLKSGGGMQMKLNRDRIQSILDEAGRSDVQIPWSVDGATIGVRIPTGVLAFYGNCGDIASRVAAGREQNNPRPVEKGDTSCISLIQLPSPVVSAPQDVDPGQIAQVALEFLGMNANDAASLTQTVDWTSTLVLPVIRGKVNYQQVHVNGNEAALLRPTNGAESSRYTLMWVDNGIVFALSGFGDDATAVNLASQL
ncbi:MAG TPA: zf-HC2 domain-containing protein [Acidobacteriaceae bacterium]|nr:zf-HC2 domain-containing protein [Acidobacteriaceae bacterium]